jgi:hypothetical protein
MSVKKKLTCGLGGNFVSFLPYSGDGPTTMIKNTATSTALCLLALVSAGTLQADNAYLVRNLVSDIPDLADNTDPNLMGAWGISESSGSPFWISDAGSGVSTLYSTNGSPIPLVVTIQVSKAGGSAGIPTGTVFNGTSGFALTKGNVAHFLWATLDGTIQGWNPAVNANAVIMVDNSSAGAEYTGLAMASNNGSTYLAVLASVLWMFSRLTVF